MELKKYQEGVLEDIRLFNGCLLSEKHLRTAYRRYWDEKGFILPQGEDYVNSVKGVPRVTLKIPTAGGKTFIACNALKTIFDTIPETGPKVVVWFVPYETIKTQTFNNLNNPEHPYRQCINAMFGGSVQIYEKEQLLMGNNFSPEIVKDQLSIMVLSIQSFATRTGDDLRSWRENGNLQRFTEIETDHIVEGADETSLMQTIARLNPVVIVDESHNLTSDLRVETLQIINPRYILELTATPRDNSNVISYVDAMQLKKENMVKLPVIVYNNNSINDVLTSAINLRNSLEEKAKEEERNGGRYIRPIVLFQAQPKRSDDTETFEKVKEKLLAIGIPENQIKIKTANKDELKDLDLMGRDCAVRYIITVDALKEGWDCPFAYILASLANKTSRISVEQILGRILRLPYTRCHGMEFLNLSYVFTCSADFHQTLTSIVEGLQRSGFSAKDYVVASAEEPAPVVNPSPKPQPTLLDDEDDIDKIDAKAVSESIVTSNNPEGNDEKVGKMLDAASEENSEYNKRFNDTGQDIDPGKNNKENRTMPSYKMKPQFAEEAKAICFPQFYMKSETESIIFGESDMVEILLEHDNLLDGFKLDMQDRNVIFEQTTVEAAKVVLESRDKDEYVPKFNNLNDKELKAFTSYFMNLKEESQLESLAGKITDMLTKSSHNYRNIADPSIKRYIKGVLQDREQHELQGMAANLLNVVEAFKRKINALVDEYEKKQFKDYLKIGKIYTKNSFVLPDRLNIKEKIVGVHKGLYIEEEKVNGFELKVITQIASLPNVKFWHRNLERGKGFCINGFINHYSDFIVVLESGKVLLIETKGDDRVNDDSLNKIWLGNKWAEEANKVNPRFAYFMAFETKEVEDAYSVPRLLELIKKM